MNQFLRQVWQLLRQATGDDAYERYLAHQRAQHGDRTPLSRRDYFRQRQEQKWSKVSRCC
jgi:uncharacterized short protein YbdD (DUF466 family)